MMHLTNKSKKFNTINTLSWLLIIVVPFLFQDMGFIEIKPWKACYENGFMSIFTGSFLHGSYSHMASNLTGILLGTAILYNLYPKDYWYTIILGIIVPGITMAIIGRPYIGISGLVFTLIWFIILRGLISNNNKRFLISIGMLLIYGKTLHSVYPPEIFDNIAWQAHLSGVAAALALALYSKLRKH